MPVKASNIADALIGMKQAQAHYVECKQDYNEQRLAFLSEHWKCGPGVLVSRRGITAMVKEIDLSACYEDSDLTRNRPWLRVRPLRKDGQPANKIVQWFGDWELA